MPAQNLANQETDTMDAHAFKEEGDRLSGAGEFEQALECYRKALAAQIDLLDAHLAAVDLLSDHPELEIKPEDFSRAFRSELLKQLYAGHVQKFQSERSTEEAIRYARALCALEPDNAEIRIVYGATLLTGGHVEEATCSFIKGLDLEPGNLFYRMHFANALFMAQLKEFDPDIKRWIGIFLAQPRESYIKVLSRIWLKILYLDPEFSNIVSGFEYKEYSSFKDWFESLKSEDYSSLLSDYFLNGLRYLIIPDMKFERFMTHMRRWLLQQCINGNDNATVLESLALAMAEQCFLNEYAYNVTEEETNNLEELLRRLESKKNITPLAVAVVGCYRPLHTLQRLAGHLTSLFPVEGKKRIMRLIRIQIKEPQAEQKIKKTIKTFGSSADETSKKVREQYEESPYPRWNTVPKLVVDPDRLKLGLPTDRPLDVLIAGCGTGQHVSLVGVLYNSRAMITAIDLSKASLAYAMRKVKELNLKNIYFLQGDILDVSSLGEQYDIIEVGGVLHHMNDPEAGWKALYDVLKPGGYMRVAVYSMTARQAIHACRAFIDEQKLEETPEGIRECRRLLAAMPEDHEFRIFMRADDFYSLSMVRDLLFHRHEDCFDIPRLKKDMDELGLEFKMFTEIPAAIRLDYANKFPDDPEQQNLDYWHQYEQDNPDTFIGMYKFWCYKPA